MERVDVVVVGGGIVGLASAFHILERHPATKLVLLEKETRLAAHQSGRNSGVLHSGLYYRPGSHKARMGVAGRSSMERFCVEHGIAHEICGKVVVATRESELDRLRQLLERGRRNGVAVEEISRERLRELEPHAAGVAALHVADTGIVDFTEVCVTLGELITRRGGTLRLGTRVRSALDRSDGSIVETGGGVISTRVVLNCAGLHSDQLAGSTDVRIAPFRGEFFHLRPERRHLVRNLIYPVPYPAFPFLGSHFTRDVHGGVHAGPNAVPALAREGYRWRDVDPREIRELITFPGFRSLARHHWRTGGGEIARSISRHLAARSLARLVPEITADDLVPAPAGVRAQALNRDGSLLDDFVIQEAPHAVHVVNAPSPAATAALEIGAHLADLVGTRL